MAARGLVGGSWADLGGPERTPADPGGPRAGRRAAGTWRSPLTGAHGSLRWGYTSLPFRGRSVSTGMLNSLLRAVVAQDPRKSSRAPIIANDNAIALAALSPDMRTVRP